MVDVSILEGVPLFRGLSARALAELSGRCHLRRFRPGEPFWRTGSRPSGLLVVLEGEVRVVRARAGRQHVVHTEGAGGTLGEVPLFAGTPTPASAVAARAGACLVVSRDAIAAAVRADPELAWRLMERLARRVDTLVARLDRVTTHGVTARLAAYLMARARDRAGAPFTLGCTQLELAEELGTVREMVVRALRRMREDGIIAVAGRGRYVLIDEARLRATAGE